MRSPTNNMQQPKKSNSKSDNNKQSIAYKNEGENIKSSKPTRFEEKMAGIQSAKSSKQLNEQRPKSTSRPS